MNELTTYIVTPEGFPFGLRCMNCDAEIPNGDFYTSRPGDGADELICLDCGLSRIRGEA